MLSSSKRHLLRHFPIHKADGIEETEKRGGKKGRKEGNSSKKEGKYPYLILIFNIDPYYSKKKSAKSRENFFKISWGERFFWVAIICTPVSSQRYLLSFLSENHICMLYKPEGVKILISLLLLYKHKGYDRIRIQKQKSRNRRKPKLIPALKRRNIRRMFQERVFL